MQLLKELALACHGIPYKWGGSNPIEGFDCSGLVQYLLQSVGMDPPNDQTAQALYDHFEGKSSHGIRALGSLVFFGKSVKEITHIGMCLDSYRMIEAGGGGPLTKTREDAARQNAFVKISMINRRKDLVAVLKPYYTPIGMI